MSRLQEIRDKYRGGHAVFTDAEGYIPAETYREIMSDLRFLLDELTPTPIVFEAEVESATLHRVVAGNVKANYYNSPIIEIPHQRGGSVFGKKYKVTLEPTE